MMMMQFLLFSIKEPDFVDASVDTSDLYSQNMRTVAIYKIIAIKILLNNHINVTSIGEYKF